MIILAWVLVVILLVVIIWLARVYTQVEAIRRGDIDEDDPSIIGAARWWARDEP